MRRLRYLELECISQIEMNGECDVPDSALLTRMWDGCLDTLLNFDPYKEFTPPFVESDRFQVEMQGLIRPTMALARAGLLLVREGHVAAADVLTRSALEHALFAQFFYLHKDEPDLIHLKYVVEQERFFRNMKSDPSFTATNTPARQLEISEQIEALQLEIKSFKVKTAMPGDSTVGDQLTFGDVDEQREFKRLYRLLSQTVHPAGGVGSYIYISNEGRITVFRDSQTITPEATLFFLSRCCIWVLAIQESMKKGTSSLQTLYGIAKAYGIQPWLKLVSPVEPRD